MKRIALIALSALLLTGCAPQKTDNNSIFETDINTFCDNIVKIDASINQISNISADEEGLAAAKADLLKCLDQLNDQFRMFAKMDFPEEYNYLEDMADEASEYMIEAVDTYHTMYEDDGYNVNLEEYADENYARAYKRVRIITALLRGETPNEEGLTIQ